MKPFINTDTFIWESVEPYLLPAILIVIAITSFAYFVSVSKKKTGLIVGGILVISAVILLAYNLTSI